MGAADELREFRLARSRQDKRLERAIPLTTRTSLVKVTLRNLNPLCVTAFYRPPQDPAENLDGLDISWTSQTTTLYKANFLVGGDFNAGDIDWDSLAVKPIKFRPERYQRTHHFPPMQHSPDSNPVGADTPAKSSGAAMHIEAVTA